MAGALARPATAALLVLIRILPTAANRDLLLLLLLGMLCCSAGRHSLLLLRIWGVAIICLGLLLHCYTTCIKKALYVEM